MARVRTMPARAERIDLSLPDVLDTVRHVDELAKEAAHERAETLRASAAAAASSHDRLTALEQTLTALRDEVREIAAQAHMGRIELDRASVELGRVIPEVREFRAEAITHQRELRAHFGPVHHDARVVFEASVGEQRDRALRDLRATLETPPTRRKGLSVVMITWNHAGFLPEALASAHAALRALEPEDRGQILILDDGSTDETAALLGSIADDVRIRVVVSPRNLGLWRARNALLTICPTTHAVILDADNWLLPDGVRAVYETARTYRPTITYGQVIASTSQGTDWSAFSYAPSAESLRSGASFDSMAVIDVDAVLAIGGYSGDPGLAGVADDFELILRCLRRGQLVGYVPVVLGRYRLTPLRHSAEVSDMRGVNARVHRSYLYDDPDFDRFSLFSAHPDTGVLWATPPAQSQVGEPAPLVAAPATRAAPAGGASSGPRVLLIVSGGVSNLGDDAISDAVHRRIRSAHPDARIELISDRDLPALTSGPVPWSGTLMELWQGLTDDELRAAAAVGSAFVTVDALTPPLRHPPLLDLASFDAAYVAGGGFLASPFAETLLRPRVAVALALAAAQVPVVWSGQGIGPCSDDELSMIAAAVQAASAFGCRDEDSLELLPGDVRASASLVGDDASGLLRLSADDTRAILRRAHVATDRFVVFHVRRAEYIAGAGTDPDAALAALADAVDEMAARAGATVVGLAINDNHPPEAEVFTWLGRRERRRAPWRVVDARRSPALAAGVLAAADAVVSHSYHLTLWALEAGTPALLATLSPYYQRKASGLSRLAGIGGGITMPILVDGATLGARLDEVKHDLGTNDLSQVAPRVDAWWGEQLQTLP